MVPPLPLLFLLLFLLPSFTVHLNTPHPTRFSILSSLLDSLDDTFYTQFSSLQASIPTFNSSQLGQYTCLYGKALLYGMLTPQSSPQISKGFFFIKTAAERFSIPECLHLLGIMYNFKMTPHFNLEESNCSQSTLKQYVKRSHIRSSEIYWYTASLLEYMPSTMVLGNLNHIGLSTKVNCTSAALYYRMVVEKVFVGEYEKHSYYRDKGSLFEEELYLRQELHFADEADDAYMVEESINMGQESYTSNFVLAQNYYYGRLGFLRNTTKAASMFEKLKEVGNMESASLLGLCYFKGEGVTGDYQKAYELFKASKNSELSTYMINVMEYYGIHVPRNKEAVLRRLKSQVKESFYAKALYGALILRGDVPKEEKMTGMVLLQESSNYGFAISKLILGMTYLDGVDISYNCPKAINHIREGLLSVDLWADKAEEAKIAIKEGKYMFALIKYLELSLTGSSVGLVNGLYLLEMYIKEIPPTEWSLDKIRQDPLFGYLYKGVLKDNDPEEVMFGDVLQLITRQQLITLLNTPFKQDAYYQYVRNKMLTICRNGGISICMFMSYKENTTNKVLLKELAKREGEKLHLLESRFLLGQLYQQSNDTEEAVTEYSRATSSLMAPLILLIEGYNLETRIFDDLLLLLTGVAITVAASVIHRNMILLEKQKKEQQSRREQEEREDEEKDETELREETELKEPETGVGNEATGLKED